MVRTSEGIAALERDSGYSRPCLLVGVLAVAASGFVLGTPAVLADKTSADGTRKWLFDVGVGNGIETVFIPEGTPGCGDADG